MKQLFTVFVIALFAACGQAPAGTATGAQEARDTFATAPVMPVGQESDTVTIGGRLFVWSHIEKSEFDAVPEMAPDTSEAVNIAAAPERVHRSGDSLVFSLENGGQKVLVNNHNDNEDMALYTYQAYIPEAQSWVVLNMGYEWFSYVLVNVRSGELQHTLGFPQLSPDKRFFIASNADLVAQFNPNGFELYEIRKNGPVMIQNYIAESWGPEKIKWKDADTFYAEISQVDEQMESTTRYVKFSLSQQ
jgi:hypothetical protein